MVPRAAAKVPQAIATIAVATRFIRANKFDGRWTGSAGRQERRIRRASLERKWLLVFAAARTLEYFYGQHFKAQVRKLHRGNWAVTGPLEDKKNQLLLRVFQHAKSGVITAYKNAKQYQPDFEHRKWIRSRDTPKSIHDVLVNIVLPADIPK